MRNHKIYSIVMMFCLSFLVNHVNAQNELSKTKRFGFDVSAVGLGVFSLYQVKGTYLLNPKSEFKSEIGLGIFFLNQSTTKSNEAFNNDGIYSAKLGTVAFRQYFWKGLHFEEDVSFGQGKVTNNIIDGRTYTSFTVLMQSFVGYKLDVLKRDTFNLFIIGQAGAAYSYQTNKWPVKENEPIYAMGDLKIGINF